tara:strand:+ start:186 stop:1328 length:1143 start_codon:yes stop_codon:yes gene_type:complete
MKYFSSKGIFYNSFLSILFLFPLLLPIIIFYCGLNIANSRKMPKNVILKSIINETREIYFRLNIRDTIQFDSNCFEISRILIYQPKKNSSCLQDNFEFKNEVNFGKYRNRLDSYGESSSYDVVVLGDSQAMGWGVSDKDIFTNVLQANGYRTLNLSVSSYGTARELFTLKKWVLENPKAYYNVKFVVLQYEPGDLYENIKYLKEPNMIINPVNFDSDWKDWLKKEYSRKNLSHIAYKDNPNINIYPYIIKNFYSRKIRTLFGQNWNYFDGIEDGSKFKVRNFNNNGLPLIDLLSRYKDILENKKIIIFVTDSYGLNVDIVKRNLVMEFSKRKEKYLNNVVFSSLDGDDISKYYYVIDDHMNALGHFEMGNKILSIIEKSN